MNELEYAWLITIMMPYERKYYEGNGRFRQRGYLKWLAEGRYKRRNPKNRRRQLLLLCA